MTVIVLDEYRMLTPAATRAEAVLSRELVSAVRRNGQRPQEIFDTLGRHPQGPLRGFAEMYARELGSSDEGHVSELHDELRAVFRHGVPADATLRGNLQEPHARVRQIIRAAGEKLSAATTQPERTLDGQPLDKAFGGLPKPGIAATHSGNGERPRTGTSTIGRDPNTRGARGQG